MADAEGEGQGATPFAPSLRLRDPSRQPLLRLFRLDR